MNLNELGFDFSNLETCSIKKKNYVLPLVTSIIGITFLPIFIVFLILFLLEVDIDFNGVPSTYGTPEYMRFFSIFLPVFGLLTIILMILTFYGLFSKPKKYMVIDKDTTNFNTYYYIHNHKRNEYIYLTDEFVLVYNERYNSFKEETNPKTITKLKNHYIFWNEFSNLKDYKIKQKKKSTVLKYKTNYRISKAYYFSNDIHIVPNKITEMISASNYSKNSIQSFTTYFFEEINRRQHVDIHPEIIKKLTSFI